MSTSVAVAGKTKDQLARGYQSARAALSRLRSEAEDMGERFLVAGAGYSGAAATGYIHGWAERTNRKLTIGKTKLTWTGAAGGVATLAGIFGAPVLGKSGANMALGLGIGTGGAELSMVTYKWALAA